MLTLQYRDVTRTPFILSKMKRNMYTALGTAMSFAQFCSGGPLSMHFIPTIKSESGKSSMDRLGLGEKIDGQNVTNQAGLGDNEEFTMWQDALIFTGILLFCILAGIMGYLLAELRDECRKAKETMEFQLDSDAHHMMYFLDLAKEEMEKGNEMKSRYVFFVTKK